MIFAVRKKRGEEKFTLTIKESEEFDSRDDADRAVKALTQAAADFKNGLYWIDGRPMEKGFYLVQNGKGFKLVRVDGDKQIESADGHTIGEIRRYMQLEIDS